MASVQLTPRSTQELRTVDGLLQVRYCWLKKETGHSVAFFGFDTTAKAEAARDAFLHQKYCTPESGSVEKRAFFDPVFLRKDVGLQSNFSKLGLDRAEGELVLDTTAYVAFSAYEQDNLSFAELISRVAQVLPKREIPHDVKVEEHKGKVFH